MELIGSIEKFSYQNYDGEDHCDYHSKTDFDLIMSVKILCLFIRKLQPFPTKMGSKCVTAVGNVCRDIII